MDDTIMDAMFLDMAGRLSDPIRNGRTKRGDRVRIKDGYHQAGRVYYYVGKDDFTPDSVVLNVEPLLSNNHQTTRPPIVMLADAIEPYPYTREESIERAIEDYEDMSLSLSTADDVRALLFAILDAGV